MRFPNSIVTKSIFVIIILEKILLKQTFTWLFCLIILLIIPTSYSLAQGETCATTIPITSVPYNYSGTTCGSGNDYSLSLANPKLCNANNQEVYINNAEDLVFEFTAPANDCYTFTIPLGSGNDGTAIHVFETCPDDPLTVVFLGWDIVFEGPFVNFPAIVNVPIAAGQTVYIVVSGETGCTAQFDFTAESTGSGVVNDYCMSAIPLQPTGSNIDADNCGEPNSWTPNPQGFSCSGNGGGWTTNENGVWYTVDITAASPLLVLPH